MGKHRTRPWQLQEAKAKFSEVFELAIEGEPQTVTRHGKDAVVILSRDQYRSLRGGGKKETLISFLLHNSPKIDIDIPQAEYAPYEPKVNFDDPEFWNEEHT
ncbi:MAG: type II toxin-antitoxin system Phd/YefM family antitoxin [Candidatus Tyrphobacter sp.]